MKPFTLIFTIIFCIWSNQTYSQSIESSTTTTFEEFTIPFGDYWNGSDGTGNIDLNLGVIFQNVYSNDSGGFWEKGWAISKVEDDTTSGFENMYASFAGTGFYSEKYAVGQQNAYIKFTTPPSTISFAINNSTYAGLSMKNGDSIAKKFGGESGNDPDYLKLVIKGYRNNQPVGEIFEYYLADYRFENNNEDYILKDWDFIYVGFYAGPSTDPNSLPDSVIFVLESSDIGDLGINTPAFFCVDDFTAYSLNSIKSINKAQTIHLFPNPANSELNIDLSQVTSGTISIFNVDGKKVMAEVINAEYGFKKMDVSSIENGFYVVEILTSKNERMVGRFVKNN